MTLDLDAVEARATAARRADDGVFGWETAVIESADDVPALVARVRELERKLAECDEETRLR